MRRVAPYLIMAWLYPGCEATEGANADSTIVDGGVSDAAAADMRPPAGDFGYSQDAAPPVSLSRVTGDLTFVQLEPDRATSNIFSLQRQSGLLQRLTSTVGLWGHHAVSPDGRLVAAVRHPPGSGVESIDGPGEVWVIDVRSRTARRVSPPGCDAGIGGLGWRDGVRLAFAMSCAGEVSAAYLANADLENPSPDQLLRLTDHEAPVRDVFPAVGTSLFAYVVDAEQCVSADVCFTKPRVWIGDEGTGLACRLTDGDADLDDLATITGPTRRLGDHNPTFSATLQSVLFTRNVGGKPAGPTGHHDLFQIGFNQRALFAGQDTCALAGTLVNQSETLLEDVAATTTVGMPGDERYGSAPVAGVPRGWFIYTGQSWQGTPTSTVWLVDPAGNREALTAPGAYGALGCWIISDYVLEGER